MEWIVALACAGLAAGTLLPALLAPPNNWDSLGYHLPRQVYWLQHGNLEPHLTYGWRQLEMPPFAEFAGLHLMILSGGDRWANLVQWFAFVATMLAASVIARDLGAGRKGQLLAALFVATLPMALQEASNTKNDLVVSLWTLLLACWTLRVFARERFTALDALALGSTAGLLVLTKGTGLVYAAPILVLALAGWWRHARPHRVRTLLLLAPVPLALNLGHFTRNLGYFGSPLGSPKREYYTETKAPGAVASNTIRNVMLHAGTPAARVNRLLYRATAGIHRLLGWDLDDPRITFLDARFAFQYAPHEEDYAGAPAHAALGGALLVAALLLRRLLPAGRFWLYLPVPYAALVLFAALLRWQPWHARLHLPILCLLAPLLGCVAWLPRLRLAGALAAVAALAVAKPSVNCAARPISGPVTVFNTERTRLMFRVRPELEGPTLETARFVARVRPRSVALLVFPDDWEYPLQRLTLDLAQTSVRFVQYDGFAPRKPWIRPEPAEVAIIFDSAAPVRVQRLTEVPYRLVHQWPPYSAYVREDLLGSYRADFAEMPFVGWDQVEGLGKHTGPGPALGGTSARPAAGPRTRFVFADGAVPKRFSVAGSADGLVAVRVRLNGVQVADWSFGGGPEGGFEAAVEFDPAPGPNELALEYAASGRAVPSVLFSKIQILDAPRR